MATLPTYDYDSEQADFARRQRILDAMAEQGRAPINGTGAVPGARTGNASMLQAVAKIISTMTGQKQQADLDSQKRGLTERYNQDLKTGMSSYLDTLNGSPAVQAPSEDAGGDGYGDIAATPANPQRAVLEAIASNHPVLRELGMAQLKSMTKTPLQAKDLLGHADAPTIEAMVRSGGQIPSNFGAKRELKALTPGEPTINDSGVLQAPSVPGAAPGAAVTPPAIPQGWKLEGQNNGYQVVRDPSGDLYQQSPTGLKKLDNAPKVNVNTADTAANTFSKDIQKTRAAALGASFDKTKEIPQQMSSLDQAENALKGGIINGQIAEPALVFSKIGEAIGIPADPKVAATEEFRGHVANGVLGIIKQLRPASDKDVEYAKQAAGADLKLSATALQNLIDSARAAGMTQMMQHSKMIESAMNGPGGADAGLDTLSVPFKYTIDPGKYDVTGTTVTPKGHNPAVVGTPAAPMKLDDYIKQQQLKLRGGK